jgi:uncharacterized protein (DUF924 family)
MTTADQLAIDEVVKFWREAGQESWFEKDEVFDSKFRDRCQGRHFSAARREFDHWSESAEGSLALMILLDQFPRNCFRGTGHMYATDPLARYYARKAIAAGQDQEVEPEIRSFFYLPFSHSELIADQYEAVELANALGGDYVKHAVGHRDIVQRFGRFPHRNQIMGRETTEEEKAFLEAGGFSG